MRSSDRETFDRTLLALVVLLAWGGLMSIPNPEGIKLGLRRNLLSGSGLSHDYLCDFLRGMKHDGLIQIRNGYRDDNGKGKVSRIIPTPALLALFRQNGLVRADLQVPPENVLLLRNAVWSEPPPQVREDEALIHRLNAINATHDLRLPGDVRDRVVKRLSAGYYYDAKTGKLRKVLGGWDESSLTLIRIFKDSWEKGGRLYGGHWQNTPKEEREHFLIDGEPTIERDFSTLHPRMLYALEGVTGALNIDPYRVPGFDHIDRSAGKVTFARLLNSQFKAASMKQPWRNRYPLKFGADEKALRHENGQPMFKDRDEFREYVTAMRAHLHVIDKHLGLGYGMKLQKQDSDLALNVIRRFVDLGKPIYPIHDSFIVKECDRNFLDNCMIESLKESLDHS